MNKSDHKCYTAPSHGGDAPLAGVTAFLLAGGKGKRLLPLTAHRPKPLLPLSGVPLLGRLLLQLEALGCPQAVITAGHLAHALRQGVEDFLRSLPKMPCINVHFFVEKSPLGTAGGVRAAYQTQFSPGVEFPNKDAFPILGNALPKTDTEPPAQNTPSPPPPAGAPEDGHGSRTFLILGGDAYLEDASELAPALSLHRQRRAAMTLLLSKSDQPTEFGLATLDREGYLTAFREKPSWAQVDGDLVSTGIYFLQEQVISKIPPGKYDFGYDLIHRLLTDRETLCGFPLSGFWCDVGTPGAYLQCQLRQTGGASFHEGASLSEGVRLRSSLLLPGVRMGRGAMADGAVIDEDCTVGPGARLGKGCVLGRGCHVCKNAILPPGTILPAGSIWDAPRGWGLGGCPETLRGDGRLHSPTSIPPGLFGDNCLVFSAKNGSANGNFYKTLGRALAEACEDFLHTTHGGGKVSHFRRIAVGADDGAEGVREMLLRGIAQGGGEACCLGEITAGAAAYLARRLRFPLTLYLHYAGEGEFRGLLFDENRLYPGIPLERPLREALAALGTETAAGMGGAKADGRAKDDDRAGDGDSAGDSAVDPGVPPMDMPGKRVRLRPGMRLYTEALAQILPPLDGRKITVSGMGREVLAAALRLRGALVREAAEPGDPAAPRAARAFSKARKAGPGGAPQPPRGDGRLFLHLSEGGGRLTVSDAESLLTPWQVIALCAGDAMRRGAGIVSLPDSAPEAVKTMVRRGGCLRLFSHTCADGRECAARNLAGEEDYLTDGAFAAVRLLRLLADASLTLREAAALLPVFTFATEEAEVSENKKAALLAAFAAGEGAASAPGKWGNFRLLPSYDGVLLAGEGGSYLRAVARSGARLCLMAEAGDDADAAALLKRAKAFFRK